MGPAHTAPDSPAAPSGGPFFAPRAADDPATVSGHLIGARLGADGPGAVGRTYLAYEPGARPVALTVVRPGLAGAEGFAARFHHDAQAAARVHGPSIVPVLGSGREGERYWFTCGYVPSLSLRAAVERVGPLPTGVVLRLVARLAEGLQTLHAAGVVHGGLRPAHVLLAADGPRVKGHGLAWIAQAGDGGTPGSRKVPGGQEGQAGFGVAEGEAGRAEGVRGEPAHPGGAGGTAADVADGGPGAGAGAWAAVVSSPTPGPPSGPGVGPREPEAARALQAPGATGPDRPAQVHEAIAFRSPEQAAGKAAGPATDVFALGQIAAYASIGAAPFGDGSRVQHAEPDLNELPGQLREIVTRCLIKDPALRPSPAQITTMCAQAAPESRPVSWLPAPLLAVIQSAVPPAPSAGQAPSRPAVPPGPAPTSPPVAPAQHPAAPDTRTPAPDATGSGPLPAAPLAPPPAAPVPPAYAAGGAPGPVQGAYAAPSGPPVPGPSAAVPDGGTAYAGPPQAPPGAPQSGYLWHPQQWPRAPYVHVPLPLPRRRRNAAGVLAGVVALVAAVTVGVAVGRVGSGGRPSAGAVPPVGAGAASPPPVSPSAPGSSPATTAPSGGLVYQRMVLPAGHGLTLEVDPPTVQAGADSGDFALAEDGSAFVSDASRDDIAAVGPDSPVTPATCASATVGGTNSLDTAALSDGDRMCVRSVDGAVTALLTIRQVTLPHTLRATAVFDVVVWRETVDTAAPGTGFRANSVDGVAKEGLSRVY